MSEQERKYPYFQTLLAGREDRRSWISNTSRIFFFSSRFSYSPEQPGISRLFQNATIF